MLNGDLSRGVFACGGDLPVAFVLGLPFHDYVPVSIHAEVSNGFHRLLELVGVQVSVDPVVNFDELRSTETESLLIRRDELEVAFVLRRRRPYHDISLAFVCFLLDRQIVPLLGVADIRTRNAWVCQVSCVLVADAQRFQLNFVVEPHIHSFIFIYTLDDLV